MIPTSDNDTGKRLVQKRNLMNHIIIDVSRKVKHTQDTRILQNALAS